MIDLNDVPEANDLRSSLENQAKALSTFGCGLMEFFVLRNGKAYTPTSHSIKQGPKKECFSNAAHLVLETNAALGKTFRYCEGYAFRKGFGFLIHHAWAIDNDGGVVDITWDDPQDCEYFGVEFDDNTLINELRLNGVYGLLDTGMINVRLMKEIDPGVVEFLEEQANKRKALRAKIREADGNQ